MIKFIKSTFGILLSALILTAGVIMLDNEKVEADDSGYWAQADRYDRFPCAGPPTDCYVLPPIIITPEVQ